MRQVPEKTTTFSTISPFFCVIILDIVSINIVTPVLAPLVNNPASHIFGLHSSNVSRHIVYGFIQALSPLCYMIGAPVLGYFSDRIGRRKVLLICLLGSFLGLLAYIISFATENLLILLFGRMVIGFTSGSLAVAQSAIADISSGAAKAKNIGMIAVAMTIGLVGGPLLGGVLSDPTVISWFNNSTPFYAGIVLSAVNLVILLTLLKETHGQSVSLKKHHFFQDVAVLFAKKNVQFILLLFFVFELGWSMYFQSIALLFSQHFHLSNKYIGFFSSYVGFVLSLFLIWGVRIMVNRISLLKIIQPCFVAGAVSLMLGYIFNSQITQYLVVIPIALMVALCYTVIITLGSDKLDSDMQGLYMGITDSLLSLAFAITGFLGSIIAIKSAIVPQLLAAGLFVMAMFVYPRAKEQYLES